MRMSAIPTMWLSLLGDIYSYIHISIYEGICPHICVDIFTLLAELALIY